MTSASPGRRLHRDGCCNVRDLGGAPAVRRRPHAARSPRPRRRARPLAGQGTSSGEVILSLDLEARLRAGGLRLDGLAALRARVV